VTATLALARGQNLTIPASLVTAGRDDYLLTVNMNTADLPLHSTAEVRLSFDSWFVPAQLGINEDTRQLSIPTPYSLVCMSPEEAKKLEDPDAPPNCAPNPRRLAPGPESKADISSPTTHDDGTQGCPDPD
jgi:hypothetical protein